ncbi:hypothetical protein B0H21DRAFT_492197 [Amylocystis lapponica]|nr:hypothetical protein B0H21DRAFT_492197 [Amylocystis lapponica]
MTGMTRDRPYDATRGERSIALLDYAGPLNTGDSPHSSVASSRNAIKAELAGKLRFNDDCVFHRLGTDTVPDTLVDACTASMGQNAKTSKARNALKKLLAKASKKSERQLEAEIDPEPADTADARDPGSGMKKSKSREKAMYNPLHTIFSFIETFSSTASRPYNRQWVSTGNATLTAPDHPWNFPKVSPDFTLLEITDKTPRQVGFQSERGPHLWRHRSAFIEIKPTNMQGPVPSNNSTVKPIVAQAADYARIHLSARPFQLFSIGLLIFGSRFCVGIFDRDGVTFSPTLDMWVDERMFIRVIRRLTCDMSPAELGQDPTVRVLSDAEAGEVRRRAEATGTHLTGAVDYPTFVVTMGKGVRCWYTLGAPIWTSLSLLGRGTEVWRVCDSADPNRLLVLKSAWRSSDRLAESTLYEGISGKHPGVADYDVGADVVFPGAGDRVISIKNLRDSSCDDARDTPILHRLLTRTYGRPMWEYDSELELLKGFRAALEGHRFLTEQGILHRDISAGNVLLSAAAQPENGHEGFITDIEFAHFSQPSVKAAVTKTIAVAPVVGPSGVLTEPTIRTHTIFYTVSVKRGAAMTGTLQFMAAALLLAIDSNQIITHELHHDLESFVWVFAYSIGMHFVSKGRDRMPEARHRMLRDIFYDNFGQPTLPQILNARGNIFGFLDIDRRLPELFSKPFALLLQSLNTIISRSFVRDPASPQLEPLTYDILFRLLDETIAKLQ